MSLAKTRRLLGGALALLSLTLLTSAADAKTSVSEKDCTITITVDIQISGAGATDAVANKIKTETEACYNNQNFKYDCCPVKVVVNVKNGGPVDPNSHQIKIKKDPKGKYVSNVKNPLPTPGGGSGSGTWSDNPAAQVYAHEVGHLMGLKDKYKETQKNPRKTEPCKGHETDKMATLSGKPQQSDINSIVEAAGVKCPDKCKQGKAKSSDSGTKQTAVNQLPTSGQTMVVALSPQASISTNITIPAALGGGTILIGPFLGSMTVMVDGPPDPELNPLSDPMLSSMEVIEFEFIGPSVELPNGMSTGENVLRLATAHSAHRSLGTVRHDTGAFEVYIEGTIENSLFGPGTSLPFESRIEGFFFVDAGVLEFTCETVIAVLPEPAQPDCNHNDVLDAQEIADGLAADVDANGVIDACETRASVLAWEGVADRARVRVALETPAGRCGVSMRTHEGESAGQVLARFEKVLRASACAARLGVTCEGNSGYLTLRGLDLLVVEGLEGTGLTRLKSNQPMIVGAGP